MTADLRRTDPMALERRLAARLAGALAERAEGLPHDITERLRVAREQALVHARRARAAALAEQAAPAVVATSGGRATLGWRPPWWQRVASVLPLLVLVLGLLAVGRVADHEQIMAAAEIDALLLADDLPPAAYSDPGFGEFLRSPPP